MRIIIGWFIRALILLLTTYFVPGFRINSFTTALIAVLLLGLLNVFIKPFLLVLALPANILTLGLFTFVVNAFLLYLVSLILPGFYLNSFKTAIVGALVIAFISLFFVLILRW